MNIKKIISITAALAVGVGMVVYANADQTWLPQSFGYNPQSKVQSLLEDSGPVCSSCNPIPGSACHKKCVESPPWYKGLIFYNNEFGN